MTALLSLRDVSKTFGGLQAVRGCNFDVQPGRITGLIGPNGAGKTTLFNMITGFLRPDSGSIRLRGDDLHGLAPHQIERRGVARTFQHLRLWQKMTVLDNVLLGCRTPLGENLMTLFLRPRAVAAEYAGAHDHAMHVLKGFGLVDRARELVESLTYPEQKLLSMARIYASEAEVILLDEPTSGLDSEWLRRVVPTVRRLTESGKTVLLIEHNIELVSELSDEIVFLHQGEVLAQGKSEEIRRDTSLNEIYFGA